jgi:MoxR-like ATPase
VPISEHVVEYAVSLARATRPGDKTAQDAITRYLSWGAGPRAGQALVLAARCLAVLEGEPTPSAEHVRRLAPAVLRHRLVLNYTAASEGVDAEQILDKLLQVTEEPAYRS